MSGLLARFVDVDVDVLGLAQLTVNLPLFLPPTLQVAEVDVLLENPLPVELRIDSLHVQASASNKLQSYPLPPFALAPRAELRVRLTVKPLQPGPVVLTGLICRTCNVDSLLPTKVQ